MDEARVAAPGREPLEERRAGEIGELATLEIAPVAELIIRRQPSLECPFAQRGRAPEAMRPAAPRHLALDVGRVAFNHPARSPQHDGTEIDRGKTPQQSGEWISGGSRQVRHVPE